MKKSEYIMLRRIMILTHLQILLLLFVCAHTQPADVICKSIEVKSMKDLKLLQNCTRVIGHVSIVNLQLNATTAESSIANELTSAVEEITDYLLVHRVHGLATLQIIFPRLTIIRGQELLFEQYAFVVYENRNLLNLGLVSMLRIQKGFIRIEENPMLCFVETVNWVYLLGNSTQQHFSLKNNKPQHYCPDCSSLVDPSSKEHVVREDGEEQVQDESISNHSTHCWNLETYQRKPITSNFTNCPKECGAFGCTSKGDCCDRNCATECNAAANNCTLCANFKQREKCVDYCIPPSYQLYKRNCVSASKCRELDMIPYAGVCLEKCADNYQQTPGSDGKPSCSLTCTGNYVIHRAKDLTNLKDCTKIQGSLTIELVEVRSKVTDFEYVLNNIKEITGYLKVTRSPQLISLNFFANLDTIGGSELIDNKYALHVVDNHHLEHIWTPNQNVAILKGQVYFHLNPRLCHEKITQLESSLKSAQKISIIDASPNSNGERVICGSAVRTLNVTVEDFNATAARIKVEPMSAEDKQWLIGYLHHYKEAPIQNVTLYDGRHGCGHDKWRMDISTNQNVRHVITNLKPYTQYAFFVKTLTMTDYHIQINAYSKIQYFRTLPSKPSPVAKMYFHSLETDKIVVYWWPPRIPNGIIEKYIVFHEKDDSQNQNVSATSYETPLKSKSSSCVCHLVDPEFSGPSPEDENYYSKEQITYDDALPNMIYVPRIEDNNPRRLHKNESDEQDTTENSSSETNSAETSKEIESAIHMHEKSEESKSESSQSSQNTITKLEKSHNKDAIKSERIYKNYRHEIERKALEEQDTGIENFTIIKPLAICSQPNVSVQYRLENPCKQLEHFNGTEVQGNIYQHTLMNLEPGVTYRISVRACVKVDRASECGSETIIFAKTFTKLMEKFLKNYMNSVY